MSRVASADIVVGDEMGVETYDKVRGCCRARSWGGSDFNGTLFQDNRPQNLIVVSKGLQGKERPVRQLEQREGIWFEERTQTVRAKR